MSKGKGYSKKDLIQDGDPIILYGQLYTNYETEILNFSTYTSQKEHSVLSDGGEVVVPSSGESPEDIARASVIRSPGIIIGGDLNVLKFNHNIDPTFIAYTISYGARKKELSRRAQGKSVVHLYNNDLKKISVMIPQFTEQNSISCLLRKIDKVITLHQRKYETLNLFRETIILQSTVSNSEVFPKLRMTSFNKNWEENTIGDLFNITRGQVLPKKLISQKKSIEKPYPVFSSQTKEDGLLGYYNDYLFENAITWTTDGANAGTVNYREGKFYSTNVNGVLLSNTRTPNLATSEILNRVAWRHVSKVGNPKLMNNVMTTIKINLPNNDQELLKLSDLYKYLNKTVIYEREYIEMLKSVKQLFLQKMFV